MKKRKREILKVEGKQEHSLFMAVNQVWLMPILER
jgi:hypothetical protein